MTIEEVSEIMSSIPKANYLERPAKKAMRTSLKRAALRSFLLKINGFTMNDYNRYAFKEFMKYDSQRNTRPIKQTRQKETS